MGLTVGLRERQQTAKHARDQAPCGRRTGQNRLLPHAGGPLKLSSSRDWRVAVQIAYLKKSENDGPNMSPRLMHNKSLNTESDKRAKAFISNASLVFLGSARPRIAKASYATFDPKGSHMTIANSINDTGSIVGYYKHHRIHGYVRSADGTITTFGSKRTQEYALSVNVTGAIVGSYGRYTFLRSADGKITTFNPAGARRSWGASINDKGWIAGYYLDTAK